jgi:hypothetical protein
MLQGFERKPFMRDYLREEAALSIADLHANNEKARHKIELFQLAIAEVTEQLREMHAMEEELLTNVVLVDQRREGSTPVDYKTLMLLKDEKSQYLRAKKERAMLEESVAEIRALRDEPLGYGRYGLHS